MSESLLIVCRISSEYSRIYNLCLNLISMSRMAWKYLGKGRQALCHLSGGCGLPWLSGRRWIEPRLKLFGVFNLVFVYGGTVALMLCEKDD